MRQIGFKNFRRFANHLTIDFGNINLLVGGNNSGKSTFSQGPTFDYRKSSYADR